MERLIMKPANQSLCFSPHAILLALLFFAMISPAMAKQMWRLEHDHADVNYSNRTITHTLTKQSGDQAAFSMTRFMVAESTASEFATETNASESGADDEVDMEAKRQVMIEKCEDNRGVDCERKVDTELEAEQLEIIHTAPPQMERPMRPRPRPKVSR
jgi:hypothetical protein